MATKKKALKLTSPVGTAKFVWVDKPSTKYKEQGEYSLTLVFSKKDITALGKQLAAEAKKAHAEAIENAENAKQQKARKGYEVVYGLSPEEDDDGKATGQYLLKLKRDAQYTSKKTDEVVNVTIPIFDAKKKPLKGAKIGRGSQLRAAFDAVPFCADGLKKAGLSLRLTGVQVIDLVEYSGGASADSLGFDEEDGYEGSEEQDTPFDGDNEGGDEEETPKAKKGKAAKGKPAAGKKGKAAKDEDDEGDDEGDGDDADF